jgi:hypothetical protein
MVPNTRNVGKFFSDCPIAGHIGKRWLFWCSRIFISLLEWFPSLIELEALLCGTTIPSGPVPPHYRGFTITLRHTALGRTPLDKLSQTSSWQHVTLTTDRQTSMSAAGLETSIQTREWLQTNALDRAATGMDNLEHTTSFLGVRC